MASNSHSDSWPKGVAALLLLRLVMWEVTVERAKRSGTMLLFSGALLFRVVLGSGIGIFVWTMFRDWNHEEPWILAAGALIVLLIAVAWPSTIFLSDAGVGRSRWWSRQILIPWSEVTAIQANKGGDRTVFGVSGKSITLTRYHADPITFEYEVRRRAKLKETLAASAPLSLGLQAYPRIPVGIAGRHKMTRQERKRQREK